MQAKNQSARLVHSTDFEWMAQAQSHMNRARLISGVEMQTAELASHEGVSMLRQREVKLEGVRERFVNQHLATSVNMQMKRKRKRKRKKAKRKKEVHTKPYYGRRR